MFKILILVAVGFYVYHTFLKPKKRQQPVEPISPEEEAIYVEYEEIKDEQ